MRGGMPVLLFDRGFEMAQCGARLAASQESSTKADERSKATGSSSEGLLVGDSSLGVPALACQNAAQSDPGTDGIVSVIQFLEYQCEKAAGIEVLGIQRKRVS